MLGNNIAFRFLNFARTAALLALIVPLASCGDEGSKDQSEYADDPQYQEAVKETGASNFKDLSDAEAFEKVLDTDIHSYYVAFLELYPESTQIWAGTIRTYSPGLRMNTFSTKVLFRAKILVRRIPKQMSLN